MKQFIQHISRAMPANLAEVSSQLKYLFVVLFIVLAGVITFRGNVFTTETLSMAPGVEETAATATASSVESAMEKALKHPSELAPVAPEEISSRTLWLARCIYSETKRPEEQELVAWSIRNRVETAYRGSNTYKEVILDPYQFSAFNPGSRKRAHYMGLNPSDQAAGWQKALAIADRVIEAPAEARPFSVTTRHYYSQRSMVGGGQPAWARGEAPTHSDRGYDIAPDRFRFYENIN